MTNVDDLPLRHGAAETSAPRALDHDDVGGLVHLFEDGFAAVWSNVEVAHVELPVEVGELTLRSGRQVDHPQILVSDFASQHDELAAAGQEGQMSLTPTEGQGR